ncbi:hypothetical protein PIB30_032293, partial [Stylosanthes scabra]|nr:hypothetical protein [Stylosanthes scabra]
KPTKTSKNIVPAEDEEHQQQHSRIEDETRGTPLSKSKQAGSKRKTSPRRSHKLMDFIMDHVLQLKMTRGTKSTKESQRKNDNKSMKQRNPKKDVTRPPLSMPTQNRSTVFTDCLNNDPTKMALVEEMGFGAFSNLPNYNLKQKMLKELVNLFDIYDNTIHVVGDMEITKDKIGKALGLSWIDADIAVGRNFEFLALCIDATPLCMDAFLRRCLCIDAVQLASMQMV